MYVTV